MPKNTSWVEISQSPPQTAKFARQVARQLTGGMLVKLVGPVGAGKTIFVKSLARALGIKTIITSPSFVLLNRYRIPKKQPCWLIHVDGYRLNSYAELADVGLDEMLGNPDYLILIEWPRGKKIDWPKVPTINIKFVPTGARSRRITFSY